MPLSDELRRFLLGELEEQLQNKLSSHGIFTIRQGVQVEVHSRTHRLFAVWFGPMAVEVCYYKTAKTTFAICDEYHFRYSEPIANPEGIAEFILGRSLGS
jgi:hypothetical protein